MSKHTRLLAVTIVLVGLAVWGVVAIPVRRGLDIAGGIRVVLRAQKDKLPKGEEWSPSHQDSIIRIMRSRVDSLGVSEPLIQRKGEDQVVLELPDIKDKERAIEELKSTARMEFRHLYNVHLRRATRFRPVAAKYTLDVSRGEKEGEDVYTFTDAEGNEIKPEVILADSKLILTGDDIKPVSKAVKDPQTLGPVVAVEFTNAGRKKFADFTRRNVGEILAIVLDGKILSAPTIKVPILDGRCVIEGNFKLEEAQRLAEFINAGALPVPLDIIQIQSVEATLGKDSVNKSIQAGIWGLVAVVAFMLLYYLLPGLLADIALGIYALLTLAVFKALHVTLTLPGIAAYILSIGMAVDANILIFERLKEELRSGKTLHAAIDAGFTRAFTSIFDSNMCTIITCIILRWLGTGPIRGFAVVLGLGVIISMFTAIVVTRTFLHLIVNTQLGSMPVLFGLGRQWVTGTTGRQLDIVGRMKIWFALSAIVLIPGLYFWLGMDGLKPGIDFTGGSLTQVEFRTAVRTPVVQKALADAGFPDSMVQRSTENPRMVFIRTKFAGEAEFARLKTAIEDLNGKVQASERVGPAISAELTNNAIKAVILASLGIVIYLSVRFAIGGLANGFRFGVCAILATLHDVGVIIGVFAVLGYFLHWEIDSLFVTAVLTIIGFSTHDTIVIFDRIRENLRHRAKGETFDSLVNRSILQSLARSINTSLTVVLTLVALLVLGAENIRHFVVALLIGVVTGTYSSIFNASQLLVLWDRLGRRQPVKTEARSFVAQELKPLESDLAESDTAAASRQPREKTASKLSARPRKRKRRF